MLRYKSLITSISTAILCLLLTSNVSAKDLNIKQATMTPEEEVCACVMCLMGEAVDGKVIPECEVHMIAFYSIEITANLIFNPKKTLESRRDYLSLCPFVEEETIDEVNNSDRRSRIASGYYLLDGTPLTWEDLYKLRVEHGFDVVDALIKDAVDKHNNR